MPALHAINQTFQLQFTQRTVDGHAADTEMLHQLASDGISVPGVHSPAARRDFR